MRASDAPSALAVRDRADVHFLAGYDHYRAARFKEARDEWGACLGIDEHHDFCEFALSVLDAGYPKADSYFEPQSPPPVTETPGDTLERAAQQAYLEGVIYYQKGDYEKAGERWRKAKELAPKGSEAASDADAGLKNLDKLGVGKTPTSLKTAPEKKDEHEALQTYFTGLIHYQKGDVVRARTEWTRALALAPEGSSVMSDAKAGLEKLDRDEASTRRDGKK